MPTKYGKLAKAAIARRDAGLPPTTPLPPSVSAAFNVRPEQALEFFLQKGLKLGFSWQDLWQAEHDIAFTVAKMMDLDLLSDVRSALDVAIANGQTVHQFRDAIEPTLQRAGWWGEQAVPDPVTGEVRVVQLGSARRLNTIFQTNMQTAYAAGDNAQIMANADTAPFLMYDAVNDSHTRPAHRAWDGIVLRIDDNWWKTHRPLNGWGCRCGVIQLDQSDLESLGKSAPDHAPEIKYYEYTNPRTGEVSQVPQGIDPGWAYNPGLSRLEHVKSVYNDKINAFHDGAVTP